MRSRKIFMPPTPRKLAGRLRWCSMAKTSSLERSELYCRVALIGGHATEIVAAHLAAPLHHHLEIGLLAVCALNEVGHGRPLGDGAVAVAELPVVIALHARVGEVVGD